MSKVDSFKPLNMELDMEGCVVLLLLFNILIKTDFKGSYNNNIYIEAR